MTTSNPTYTSPFTGQTVSPSPVSYESITLSANTTLQWSINGNNQNQVTANIIEVSATTGGLTLYMPPATQVSTGQAMIIRNTGSNTFTVASNNSVTSPPSTTIVSATAGVAYYIYVIDNTTIPGTWNTVTFGAGTSAANAATLAGYGLTAIGATLNQQTTVQTYSTTATISSSNRAQINVWTGGVGTFNLPSASAVGSGWFTIFKNDGTGILTLTPNGTDTIDGNANQQLQLTESIVLISFGSGGWYSYAYGRSNQFAYTELALSVTGGTLTLSSAQAANTIQIYTGVLTSNQIIVVPSTVQLYAITNNTTGSYTFTVKTSVGGGATVTISQNTSLILICDGTNVYNAASGSSSTITSLTLGNGSTSVPSLKFVGDANTGLYLPASGQLGVVVGNAEVAYFSSTYFYALGGIAGGGF
jgi:hypothetical protein